MIVDVSPLNRSESDFFIFSQGARLLKSSNRFTALGIGWIEMNLERVTLDISPRIGSESDFYGSYV